MMVVAVLAGGLGRRIGIRKAQVKFFNKRLIDVALEKAFELTDTVVVSCGKRFIEDVQVEQVVDVKGEGPVAGIYSVLLRYQRVLFIPVDMPFLSREVLLALWNEAGEFPAVVARAGDFLFPTVGVYDRSVLGTIEDLIEDGIYSLRKVIERIKQVKVVDFSSISGVKKIFFNINTQEDLRVAKGWAEDSGYL